MSAGKYVASPADMPAATRLHELAELLEAAQRVAVAEMAEILDARAPDKAKEARELRLQRIAEYLCRAQIELNLARLLRGELPR